MYITKSTFYTGKPGAIVVIPAGRKISAGDLGVDSQTIARYIKLDMLSPLLEPEKSSSTPAPKSALRTVKKSAALKKTAKKGS